MSKREIKNNKTMMNASTMARDKVYKYDDTGNIVEVDGVTVTLGDNDIAFTGSKSNLRRLADAERNISILATRLTDGSLGEDSIKANITIGGSLEVNGGLGANVTESIQDIVGGMVTGSETGMTVTYDDNNGTLTFAVADNYVDTSGDTMSGVLNMGDNFIQGLKTPLLNSDAATKGYVDSSLSSELSNVAEYTSWFFTDGTNISEISDGGSLIINPGTNIDISYNSTSDEYTISSTDTNDVDYINNASFNTADGVLTLSGVGNAGATVDLDGRYALEGHVHNYDNYISWTASDGTNTETVGSGDEIKWVGTGATTVTYDAANNQFTIDSTDTDTDTNDIDYINSASFDTGNGILSMSGVGNAGATVNLDGRYLTSETLTSLSLSTNTLEYTDENGNVTTIDLSLYLDDSNLARITSGTVDGTTGMATFKRDDDSTFEVDFSDLFDDTNLTRINSASFSGGLLTLTRTDATTAATVNLDGRYQPAGTYDNYGHWVAKSGLITSNINSGDELEIVGDGDTTVTFDQANNKFTISSTNTVDTNDIDYINSASFSGGLLTLGGVGNAGANVSLDGRYVLLSDFGTYDNYGSWTASDGSTTEAIGSGDEVKWVGSGATSVSYDAATNQFTISSTDTNTDTNTTYDLAVDAATPAITLTGSDATTDTVTFTGSGATTVTRISATEIQISSTDTNTDTNTTYGVSVPSGTTNIRLAGSDATTDDIEIAAGNNVTITRTSDSKITISSTDTDTNTTYGVSVPDGTTAIRLAGSDATTDDITLVAGNNVSIVRDSDSQITINSSYVDTNTWRPVTDTPEDDSIKAISAKWALDNVKTAVPANAVFTDTTYSIADATTAGLVKIGFAENGKDYPVELDNDGKMFVNVPWVDTDTDTTYTAGTGLTLSGTEFSITNTGVTAGTYNNVTVNGQGQVTSGSNVAYLTSYTETDTLDSVTGRGNSTSNNITVGDLTTTGDAVIGGNLRVDGNVVTINTETVTLEDNIILLNSTETGAPTENAGIEVERGTATNVSFVWNETDDTWDAGSSSITASQFIGSFTGTSTESTTANVANAWAVARTLTLNGDVTGSVTWDGSSDVTMTTDIASALDNYVQWTAKDHDGSVYTITSGDTLWFKEGTGVDVNFTADDELTISNTDRGSSQNIFKNFVAENPDGSVVGTIVADNNDDTLHIREGQVDSTQGIELTVDAINDRLTITHANTSNVTNLTASGRTYVTGLTFDTYGHVTGVNTGTETVVNTDTLGKNIVGAASNATADATATNGNVWLNHIEGTTVKSNHKISGTGATTVTSDSSGNIIINSTDTNTDTNTTYSISAVDGANASEEILRLTAGGSGSGTDDVIFAAGTDLDISRSGDKITYSLESEISSNVSASYFKGNDFIKIGTSGATEVRLNLEKDGLGTSDSLNLYLPYGNTNPSPLSTRWETDKTEYYYNSTNTYGAPFYYLNGIVGSKIFTSIQFGQSEVFNSATNPDQGEGYLNLSVMNDGNEPTTLNEWQLQVRGTEIKTQADIVPNAAGTYNLGTSTNDFNNIYANKFIVTGSSGFLKADGTVDTNTYLTSAPDTNTTYTLTAAQTGGNNANPTISLNAGGSGSGSDTVQLTGGGATSINRTSDGGITISSTNTTYGIATKSTAGLVKVGSDTSQSTGANSVTSTSGRTYAIQKNASNQLVVNVPWSDTNTDTNNYLSGLSFNTGNGVLTATRSGLSNLTVDLDGRYQLAGSYLTSESDTLDSVTDRGNSTSNTITVGGLNVDNVLALNTANTTTTSTTVKDMAMYSVSDYVGAKFIISARNTSTGETQMSELLITNTTTAAHATEYGTVFTGSACIASYDVSVSGGAVRLLITSASANTTKYQITANYIKV